MHIHRTGGQSLSAALRLLYSEDEICPQNTEHGVLAQNPDDLAKYRLFMGHISPAALTSVFGSELETITLLRDPRARIISAYNLWHSRSGDPGVPKIIQRIGQMTFEEFLSSGETQPCVRDVQWRLLNGARFGRSNETRTCVGDPEIPPSFAFVGQIETVGQWLSERFEQPAALPHLNRGKSAAHTSDQAEQLILENTQLDRALLREHNPEYQ